MEIGEHCDRENDDDYYIRCAKNLPRVFAIDLQNILAELGNILGTGHPVKLDILQEGVFIETLEDFIREIIVTNGQSMPHDVLDGLDTKIAIDTFEYFPGPLSSFWCAGKQIAIQ